MSERKKCFHDHSRYCTPTCMAYQEEGQGSMQSCVLLVAAAAFIGVLAGQLKAQASSVTYPASPPAPEVR